MAVPSSSQYDVFLSHSSVDKPRVEELARRLKQAGIEPFLDKWNLIPGLPWQEALEEALGQSAACAVIIGSGPFGPWHHEEMRAALEHRVSGSRGKFPVIPVLLPEAQRPQDRDLPMFLKRMTWVEFPKSLDDEEAVHRLVCGVRGLAPGPGPGQAIFEGECPYRGLEVFEEKHARFFFGREAQVDWLLGHRLAPMAESSHARRFLAILGPSGSGKSSLALAGLVPALREGKVEGSVGWPIVVFRPGSHPLESLAIDLSRVGGSEPSAVTIQGLISGLAQDRTTLHVTARLALREAPAARLVILVDQFEEIFTLCTDEALRRALIENLLHAATVVGGPTLVLLTMRADFLGKCATYPDLAAALSDGQELVGPMTEPELRLAIEHPAALVGCTLEPGLTDLLLQEVQGQAGALPLLEYTLLELWRQRRHNCLTVAAYHEMGKVQGALERRADEIYRSFNPEEQGICRRIFLHLVQLGEGTGDTTKRRVSYRELVPQDPERAEAVRKVLLRLADPKARLITTTGADVPEAEGSVEVAHEALIRHWSELRKWIDAEREFLRSWARLRATARHWEEEGRRRDLLLPEGRLLAEAEDLLLCHESELDPDVIAYARTSITKNNRRGLYIWISICLFASVPSLLWAGHDLAYINSARTMYYKMLIPGLTNLDIILGCVSSIPTVIVPLWVTYRKWRGCPEFETIYLDKAFWAANFTFFLIFIIFIYTLIIFKTPAHAGWFNSTIFFMLSVAVFYTVWAIGAAAQLWKKARVHRYYKRRRDGLCTLEAVRMRLSLMSKAGLTFVLFVGAVLTFVSPAMLPGVLERQRALELYQARREIADYQVRDGQLERAQDSLNRALNLAARDAGAWTPRPEAEKTASLRRQVETLTQMGMVLRIAGKPQEAERRFREALGMIHNPWPAFKELKYLLDDAVATPGRSTSYLGGPSKSLEQAIEYDMRLPLLILASKMGAAPTVAQILGNGADVETRAEDGSTALIMAAATGYADVVKQLLASGADVEARTHEGFTALMAAAFQGRAQVVETLLRHGVKVNATNLAGGTALMNAASAGHADVVKQLLAAGSDRWLRRWNGETAATLASFQGHEDVLASLFDVERFSIELMHEKATEPGGKDAVRHADALVCAGDLAGRSGDFGKAASLFRQALEAIPERDDAMPQRFPVLVRFSIAKAAAKEYEVAVQYMERAIAVSEALAKRHPETALVRKEIANLYGSLASYELFCKRPQRAIAAARTALELNASQVWIKAMLAHGLLLAGHFEEAKNLYLENHSVRLGNGQSFARFVFLNFGELRANGISHPDMGRIENLLRTGNGARDVK